MLSRASPGKSPKSRTCQTPRFAPAVGIALPNPHDSEPSGSPNTDSSGGHVEPSVPRSLTESEARDSTTRRNGKRRINSPGGIWSVLAIGAVTSVLFSQQAIRILVLENFAKLKVHDAWGWAAEYLLAVMLWLGGFACVGALLAGTAKQRLRRAVVMDLISIPAFIVYAPVLFFGLSVTVGPDAWFGPTYVAVFISVIGMLLLTSAAIALRAVTRRRLRQEAKRAEEDTNGRDS